MLCSVPIFSVTTYKKENEYFYYGPLLISKYVENMESEKFQMVWTNYIEEQKEFA